MKNKSTLFARAGIFTGSLLGAFALSALASTTWTAPSAPAPANNVATPLNVGTTDQVKQGGSIQINGGFGIAGGSFAYLPTGVVQTAGMVLASDPTTPGKVVWTSTSTLGIGPGGSGTTNLSSVECFGEGISHVIGDGAMNDGGGSTGGDQLQVYCHNGVAKICLSGETNCPWRGVADLSTVDTTHTCSMHGLNSASAAPSHSTWTYMANAWGDMWNGNSNYYCEPDPSTGSTNATRLGFKHVYYLTTVNGVCTQTSDTVQPLATNSFKWLVSAIGGDGTSYTYTWTSTDFVVATTTSVTGNSSSMTLRYAKSGNKTASVAITSGGQVRKVTCTPTVTVQ